MCTRQFLDVFETKPCPAGEKEREILLQLKKEEHAERGLPFDDKFYIYV
jgi:metallopeptidase MepB